MPLRPLRTLAPTAWRFALAVCAAFAAGAGQAEAGFIIYDSTPGGNFGTFGLLSGGTYMESFSTGASPVDLTSVTAVFNKYGSDNGITTATLLADAGATPGAVLTTIGTVNNSAYGSVAALTFTPASPYLLAANTRYWVQFTEPVQPGGAGVGWDWTYQTAGTTGVVGEYAYYNGSVYSTSSFGAYLMTVNGDVPAPPANAVPAPSGLILLGSAVPVLAAALAWRRNRLAPVAG